MNPVKSFSQTGRLIAIMKRPDIGSSLFRCLEGVSFYLIYFRLYQPANFEEKKLPIGIFQSKNKTHAHRGAEMKNNLFVGIDL